MLYVFFFLFELIVWANKIPVTAKKSEWLRFPWGLISHLWIGFNGLILIDKSAVFSVFWSLGRYSTPTCWPYVSGVLDKIELRRCIILQRGVSLSFQHTQRERESRFVKKKKKRKPRKILATQKFIFSHTTVFDLPDFKF